MRKSVLLLSVLTILALAAMPVFANGGNDAAADETITMMFMPGVVGGSALSDAVDSSITGFESNFISEALVRYHGNKTRTADGLGISRKTLARKMDRYNL